MGVMISTHGSMGTEDLFTVLMLPCVSIFNIRSILSTPEDSHAVSCVCPSGMHGIAVLIQVPVQIAFNKNYIYKIINYN